MRIKFLFFLSLFSCTTFFLRAQDEIVYDQYHFNYYLVNPAVAGAERCSHLMLTGKFQWMGMDDAPMTQTLSFRTRVLKNVGLGAYVYNDRNGYSYRQGGQATFAYHIPLSENSGYFMKDRSIERQLSFGISAVA
ncbi:MAG: PorP/SprF family type IX secretion system membrane protein, partial [Paludibacteraceae bacterium]|nr:PorP/SprF family type IX secretion system membrane protein [Paludibacteraceae bacterium]